MICCFEGFVNTEASFDDLKNNTAIVIVCIKIYKKNQQSAAQDHNHNAHHPHRPFNSIWGRWCAIVGHDFSRLMEKSNQWRLLHSWLCSKKIMCCLCGVFGGDLLTTDPPTPISTKSWDKKEEDCSVIIYINFGRNLIVFNNKIGKLLCIKSGWETTGLELVAHRL